MTYLDQHVTLTWGQIFTCLFKVTMFMLRRALTRGTGWWPNYATSFLVQKLFAKNLFVITYFDVF